jgi:hypothetical protein
MKKHVITSKTFRMATPLQDNPEFSHFVNYMGVQLTEHNVQIYSDLYRNFTGWPSQDYSFAEKFIGWKRFYDEYKETQEQVINTNLFTMPPTDPRVLKTTNVPLPHDLRQLNTNTFQHFILQNDPQPSQTPTDGCSECSKEFISQDLSIMDTNTLKEIAQQNVEIVEEVLQQSEIPHGSSVETPQYPIPPKPNVESSSQGKNIAQMKAIYNSEKKNPDKPPSRKRKEPQQNEVENDKVTVIVGPGRPSKDDGLLRDAQNEEDSNNDDESIYAFREVLLLTGNGTIRKKTKLLTKQSDRDMRCFAIKHFASLEYIAEKKKKSFAIIKKERQKLKTLNYLELNTINDMKEINNM